MRKEGCLIEAGVPCTSMSVSEGYSSSEGEWVMRSSAEYMDNREDGEAMMDFIGLRGGVAVTESLLAVW